MARTRRVHRTETFRLGSEFRFKRGNPLGLPCGVLPPVLHRCPTCCARWRPTSWWNGTPPGRYWLGVGVAALARSVRSDLQTAALPRLGALAEELDMTAFLVVRVGGEAVTVSSAEPNDTAAHVVYRPGTRHPLDRGAPGLALLMPEAPSADDRDPLRKARQTS